MFFPFASARNLSLASVRGPMCRRGTYNYSLPLSSCFRCFHPPSPRPPSCESSLYHKGQLESAILLCTLTAGASAASVRGAARPRHLAPAALPLGILSRIRDRRRMQVRRSAQLARSLVPARPSVVGSRCAGGGGRAAIPLSPPSPPLSLSLSRSPPLNYCVDILCADICVGILVLTSLC